jgi:hypothetical protein
MYDVCVKMDSFILIPHPGIFLYTIFYQVFSFLLYFILYLTDRSYTTEYILYFCLKALFFALLAGLAMTAAPVITPTHIVFSVLFHLSFLAGFICELFCYYALHMDQFCAAILFNCPVQFAIIMSVFFLVQSRVADACRMDHDPEMGEIK